MNANTTICQDQAPFFLSNVLKKKVLWHEKSIGKLADMVIKETGILPQVTHIVVGRSFGYPSLVIPTENIETFTGRQFLVKMDSLEQFAQEKLKGLSLLNDHVMDKKVVDMEDHEVEMVYDIKLAYCSNGIFVTDVDASRYSFLRRLGLGGLADWINTLAESLKRDDIIPWKYVQPLSKELGSFSGAIKLNILKQNIREIHPMDLADIIEELDPEERLTVFNALSDEKASDTLEEIEPRVQREIITSLGDEKAADLIEDMTPAQAADVLSALPAADADDILALIDEKDKAKKIEALMDEHDKSLMDFVTTNFIRFAPDATVADVVDQYKDVAKDMDAIWYIYVVTPEGRLAGEVNFHTALRAEPTQCLRDIMVSSVKRLWPDDTLAKAAQMFDTYMFRALPVVDEDEMMQGVILYKDVMRLKHTLL